MVDDGSASQNEELVKKFLAVDRSELKKEGCPKTTDLQQMPSKTVLSILERKRNALERWKTNLSGEYLNAFSVSGRNLNVKAETEKYKALKRSHASSKSLQLFLEVVMEHPNALPDEPSMEDQEKLKSVKKERNQVAKEIEEGVCELASLYEEVSALLETECKALQKIVARESMDGKLEQVLLEKAEAAKEIQKEEETLLQLHGEITILESELSQVDPQEEDTEIELLQQGIHSIQNDVRSDQERKDTFELQIQQTLRQIHQISTFLTKLGQTELESIQGSMLVLRLHTSIGPLNETEFQKEIQTFTHRVEMDVHPVTYNVHSVHLTPSEAIDLNIFVGPFDSVVADLRNALFVTLTRKSKMEECKDCHFVCVDASRGIWRVAMSKSIEIEISFSSDWPFDPSGKIQLLKIQSLKRSIHFDALEQQFRDKSYIHLNLLLEDLSKAFVEMGI